MTRILAGLLATLLAELPVLAAPLVTPLEFQVRLEVPLKHDDGQFLWYHPRAATIPPSQPGAEPRVCITLQKHMGVSDYFGGLHVLWRCGLDGAWSGPELPPALERRKENNDVTISVADVTPGWH